MDDVYELPDIDVYDKLDVQDESVSDAPASFTNDNIVDLQTQVDNALVSANGKNKVYYQPNQPSSTGNVVGDTWFDTDDGNKIYQWNGSAWVQAQFGTNAIAPGAITDYLLAGGIDAGKITAGQIDASIVNVININANNINAGTLDADKISGGTLTVRDSSTPNANSSARIYGGAYSGNPSTLVSSIGTSTTNALVIGGGTNGGEPATSITLNTVATVGTKTIGTPRLTIDGSGNVGIGTLTPTAQLEVMGDTTIRTSKATNTNSSGRVYGGAYSGNPLTLVSSLGSSTSNSVVIGGGTNGGEPATNVSFATTPSVGTMANGTTRMTIDSSGKVGVGTTSPAKKLHVVGDAGVNDGIRVESNSQAQVNIVNTTASTGRSYTIVGTGNGNLAFYDDDANGTRFFINSTGLVTFNQGTCGTAANYTSSTNTTVSLTNNIDIAFITAPTVAWTLALPSPQNGKRLTIVRTDATAFVITVSGNINGSTTPNTSWFPVSTANRRVELVSNGNWWYPVIAGTVL